MQLAFPGAPIANGLWKYYGKSHTCTTWECFAGTLDPVLSVKYIIKTMKYSKLPNRGDKILVSSLNDNDWYERIFVSYIKGSSEPVICVREDSEKNYNDGNIFVTSNWKYWKPIENKKLTISREELAQRLNVDEVEII